MKPHHSNTNSGMLRCVAFVVVLVWFAGLLACGVDRIGTVKGVAQARSSHSHSTNAQHHADGSDCDHRAEKHHTGDDSEDSESCCSDQEFLGYSGKKIGTFFVTPYSPISISLFDPVPELAHFETLRSRKVCVCNRGKIPRTPLLILGPAIRSQAPPLV